jgi:hypothetical protein
VACSGKLAKAAKTSLAAGGIIAAASSWYLAQ